MQIFCVIPHPLRDHFAIILRPLYPINVLSVSYVYLFLGAKTGVRNLRIPLGYHSDVPNTPTRKSA